MDSTGKGNSLHATTASVGCEMLSPHCPSAATGIAHSGVQPCSPHQLIALGYCKKEAMKINFPPSPKPSQHTRGSEKAPEGNNSNPWSLPECSSWDISQAERPFHSTPSQPAEPE